MPKGSKTVMLTLRIPISLRARLRKAAKGDYRSVNGLAVALLSQALKTTSTSTKPSY